MSKSTGARRGLCLISAAMCGLALSHAALAQGAAMPEGTYPCSMISGAQLLSFGVLEVAGNSYRGPAMDEFTDGWYPYEMTAEGVVFWGGPLGGLTSDGNSVDSSVFGYSSQSIPYVRLLVRTESGGLHTIDCEIE